MEKIPQQSFFCLGKQFRNDGLKEHDRLTEIVDFSEEESDAREQILIESDRGARRVRNPVADQPAKNFRRVSCVHP